MSAQSWLTDFHELIRKKSERIAVCEIEKGELEAAVMLMGSRVLQLFPNDIQEGEQVPMVIIRLLEELNSRRIIKESKDEF